MATSTQVVPVTKSWGPLALWHLLSLDAPTVAALWTWFVARANHVRLPLASPVAMGLAVWMLYAADRLLDAQRDSAILEARHLFHSQHRRGFLVGIAAAGVVLGALLPEVNGTAIRLFLCEGTLLLLWFGILHGTRSAHRLPKEIATGLFFAAAIFIPTVAREPGLRLTLFPMAILFVALCSLNCLFIYKWENQGGLRGNYAEAHPSTRMALHHLTALAVLETAAGFAFALFDPYVPRLVGLACGLASALLLALDWNHKRLGRVILRAAADLVLLTPLLFLAFLR